jgi:hypothetical protein
MDNLYSSGCRRYSRIRGWASGVGGWDGEDGGGGGEEDLPEHVGHVEDHGGDPRPLRQRVDYSS